MIAENKITWHNKNWFLYKINISDSYSSYLATEVLLPEIRIGEIQFWDRGKKLIDATQISIRNQSKSNLATTKDHLYSINK